jgi:hypothetical protein
VDWTYQKVTGERLFESELTPRGMSAGVAISVPWLWGGGEWDAGFYYTPQVGGKDIGFGRGTIDAGFHKGSVNDLACRENVEISAHYMMHGGSFSIDGNDNSLTGVSYNFGPGLYGGIVGAPTAVYSIRHGFK